MESAPADMLTGRMLDRRYHVRSRIAHGGMATVYLATDTRLDREVALKVMHADLARDADFVGRFIGEAKSVARLSHPNIVAVFDQGADGQHLYLAMEYVPGRTLRALLRERGRFGWQEALGLMDPVLAGLAAAHQAGIVHRDVKPENVLITADGRVKVVDFGLARAVAAVGSTRAGVIIGSVAYIAPEQVTGAVTDARSDVYAAGIMLFELLTGRQPYSGETPLAMAYAHVNSDVPAPSEWVAGVPPVIDQLVRAATSRDPARRPADASVFVRVVRTLRGVPDPGDAVNGAWTPPIAAAGPDTRAETPPPGAAHTMVVGTDYGAAGHDSAAHAMTGRYDTSGGYGYGEAAGGGHSGLFGGGTFAGAGAAGPGATQSAPDWDGEREPFLQRWLFSRRLAYLAVAALAVIGLGGGTWWLASGRYAIVPSVAGLSESAARQALVQAGFQVHDGTPMIDNNVPKGEVVSTSPSGRALPGTTVMLTVSLGSRMIRVPSVAGKSLTAAEAILHAAGLTVSSTTKPVGVTGPVNLGAVVGTTPAAGTSWPQNRPVIVEVDAGLALPSLIGEDIGSIQQWAAENHITLRPATVASGKPQGIIITQSPAAGTPVKPGQLVSVSVSQGPPMVPIPNVRGESFQQAQQTLRGLGFKVVGKQYFVGQKVFSTSPSGSAPAGSVITVYYGL